MHLDIFKLKYGYLAYRERLCSLSSARVQRQKLLRDIVKKAEGGKIAVVWSGRDCDGVQYSGDVSLLDATKAAVEHHVNHTYEWADGPCDFYLERPSVAGGLEYGSRDLTLEAFEDGHQHVIYG